MTGQKIEIHETPVEEQEEELVEELSAMEQAMTSEEHQNEGTFLTGGNTRDFVELEEEKDVNDELVLNPAPVIDGEPLLDFLRGNLHKFDSPYAYIGGEANSPAQDRYAQAEVKILIARLSTYESTSLSMSHSLMAQTYSELPYTFCDLAFLPKPNDYKMLKENKFPVWFGTNTKLSPHKFDLLSITHAVSMEQLNFVCLLHDSGIPLFKEQRMERDDIPIIVVGGANSGTTAPLSGPWFDSKGVGHQHFIDAVIYGDGEESAKLLVEVIRDGKQKGLTKREILRNCHGKVPGFYEPDCYEHVYDGKSRITEIKHVPGREYAAFPVTRANVDNLDTVRTLETKILPYTGDGASVDVAIAGSVGCIGSAGWGACSFCREGSEGPYRERSLDRVMEALGNATKNQGTKEVSFFSLNFNQYSDLFPLVAESVKKGYKVGLISQRIDMLAETPEQIKVQRWLKKSNFTLGVEGISGRMRAYLNKNLQEWEILVCAAEMMKEGAGELKFFQIVTGLETDADVTEFCMLMEKVNALRQKIGASTRFRVSFTPLFPSAFTALQFAPANAAIKHGSRSLDRLFQRAKELGWGRRLSVSGEEPLISNTINHGGRNITHLLIDSHFKDGFRFYGNVPKGTWQRWQKRAEADPNINYDVLWGEKSFEYIFPWEDISYSTSKEILWRGYMKAVAFQGLTYCLSTRTIKGVCIAEGEQVMTTKGLKAIETIEEGDLVYTQEGPKLVKAKINNGERSTVYVRTTTGQSVRCTPDHRIMMGDGSWVEAQNLNAGDHIRIQLGEGSDQKQKLPGSTWISKRNRGGSLEAVTRFPEILSPDTAWLLGYWTGNGNVYFDETGLNGGKVRFCVANSQPELKEIISNICKTYFDRSTYYLDQSDRGAMSLVYNGSEWAKWWRDLDFKNGLPDFIMQADYDSARAFLQGLWDADGGVHFSAGHQLSCKSVQLAKDVQLLMQSIGIETKVGPGHNTQAVRVRGPASEKLFEEIVGYRVQSKAALRVMRKSTRDFYQKAEISEVVAGLATTVWDLEVEDAHHFSAGGIVVHNCHVNECGACDPDKDGKPNTELIKKIVGRRVAPTIPADKIAEMAQSREKSYHLRVLFRTTDPIYRFVLKGYFQYAIPRAMMLASKQFDDAYIGAIGHARIAAGANMARDWTFGHNIYDFSLSGHIPESELKKIAIEANKFIKEGEIVDIRMDSHLTVLRNDVDFAVYSMFIPNSGVSFKRLRDDIEKYFERKFVGKESKIKVKKTQGKGIFVTVEQTLDGQDIRTINYQWEPELRGTVVRMVISANYNPMAMLEAITNRKQHTWKEYAIYCDGYVQTGNEADMVETDVFASLFGEKQVCDETGLPLERDLFTGKKMLTGLSLSSENGIEKNYPLDLGLFFTRQLKAIAA